MWLFCELPPVLILVQCTPSVRQVRSTRIRYSNTVHTKLIQYFFSVTFWCMSNRQQSCVRVGVGVAVTSPTHHPGCVLLGERRGKAPGTGKFAFPGGHLEMFESWEECAARECMEETGLVVFNARIGTVLNATDADSGYHYVVPIVICETVGEPQNMEPEKCAGWDWYHWSETESTAGSTGKHFPANERLFLTLRLLKERGFCLTGPFPQLLSTI